MSDEDDMTPLYRLLVLGFLAHTSGSVERGRHCLMCIRQRVDMLDTVRVDSPDRAVAVRTVGSRNVLEFFGSFAEVVAEIEEWPLVTAATLADMPWEG